MKDRFDIHQEITNRIVSAIEAGAGDFKLPWHRAASTRAPINATTGRAYRGVNILSLWITTQALGYELYKWATFKQWQERGASVRKGEKGTPIVFYKNLAVDAREGSGADGEESGRRSPLRGPVGFSTLPRSRATRRTPRLCPSARFSNASPARTRQFPPRARGSYMAVPAPATIG